MKISFDCYASAYHMSDPDQPLNAAQCRAAGLDGFEETGVEIAAYVDDPLIPEEGVVDAGIRSSIDQHGHLSFRSLTKFSSKQLRAFSRELVAQLLDGWGEGHTIETLSGVIAIDWFEHRGKFSPKFRVSQADDGGSVADRQAPDVVKAAEKGDVRTLQAALDAGGDANARGKWGATALMLAARDGHGTCVDLLLQRGAHVNRISGTSTALGHASTSGHAAIVRKLLAAGADPSLGEKPALHWAANRGHEEVARILIESGANKSAIDDRGETALFLVQKPEMVRLLVQAGMDPEVRNPSGETALEHALRQANSFERLGRLESANGWLTTAEELRRWSK
jgi:hypothetical protein